SAQTLHGTVTDTTTGKPLYPVTVVNTVTKVITYTDEGGYYTIAAKQDEVVAFSYVGYKTVSKITPHSILIASLNVTMDHAEYELPEYKLSHDDRTQYQ